MVRKLTHEEAVQKLIDNDIKFKLLSPYTKRTDIHTFLCYCGKEFESSYNTIITGGILSCGCHKNYIGKKFHYLTVIEKTNKKRYDRPLYKCVCECGKEVFTTIHMMSQGDMVSCGCKRMMDHTNKRFGSLVAIKHIDSPNGQPRWLCKCDCGREKIIKGSVS